MATKTGYSQPKKNSHAQLSRKIMKTLAQLATIILFALVMGVFWGTWFSLARSMSSISATTFLEIGQTMIQNLRVPMAILSPTAIIVSVATLFVIPDKKSLQFYLAVAGAVLMTAAIGITLLVNVPIDNQIKTWTAATLPANWMEIRERWETFHTARTFVSLFAFAAVVISALLGSHRNGLARR